jgi:alpha-mannosidase
MRIRMMLVALTAILLCLPAVAAPPPQGQTAYITGASHIDLEWKWRFTEAIDVCKRTFGAVLDMMDDYDGFEGGNPVYYSQSQALAYQKMEEEEPELFARIAQRVAEGRWEIVGGMWVESDANLPGGESFVRQLFYGKRYFQDKFGVDVKIGWLPDSFGYNGNLPQFFARAGVDDFFYFKTNWNDTHPPTIHNFWWDAPDGSRVLAHLAWGQYNNQVFTWSLRRALEAAEAGDPDKPGILYPIGMGDHGGGIGRRNINYSVYLADQGWPMHFGPAADFFAAIRESATPDVIANELYLEMHRGAYTSRAKHKEQVRALEYGFMSAESLAARAWLDGGDYPAADFADAWSALMLDEFHDTMAGTALSVVYDVDVAARNAAAFQVIDDAESAAASRLAGSDATIQFPGEGWFVAYNALGFPLTTPVLAPVPAAQAPQLAIYDADGAAVPCQVDVDAGGLWFLARDLPAYGWRAYRIAAGEPGGAAPYEATTAALENAHVRLTVDPDTGLLSSIVAKDIDDRELIQAGAGGNVLQIYNDRKQHFDAWDIGFNKYTDLPIEVLDHADEIALVETGPVRSVVRITRHGEAEDYQQDVILVYDLPRVDFTTKVVGWGQEMHRFLKAAFPLDLVNERQMATSEIPYGTITRVLDGHVADWEFPGHKWTDIAETFDGSDARGPGAALFSREKYGYDVANDGPGEGLSDGRCNILRLSMLKSSESPRYLLPDNGGPVTDQGDFTMRYAFAPHDGDARDANLLKMGNEFYAPIVLRFVGATPPPELPALLEASPDNALAIWLKAPEGEPQPNRVIVRVVESQGKAATARLRFAHNTALSARAVNLLEQPDEQTVNVEGGDTAVFALGANEIITLEVELGPPAADDDESPGDDDESPGEESPPPASGDDDDEGACGC